MMLIFFIASAILLQSTASLQAVQSQEHPASLAQMSQLPLLDPTFAPRFEVEGTVEAVVVQPDHKIILAGSFQTVNGELRDGIARLNPDGTLDQSFRLTAPLILGSPMFRTLTLLADGKLVVGGSFSMMGSDDQFRHHVARLDADGRLDETFIADVNGSLYTLLEQPDGKLVVGGEFTQVAGEDRQNLARLNADGSLDPSFGIGEGADGAVYALAQQTDGKLLLGGMFRNFNGTAAYYLARLESDGTRDATFAVNANDTVYAIAVQPDGKIVFGGAFNAVNDVTRFALARVQPDGTLDDLNPGMFYEVKSILALADNSLVLGGWFSSIIFGGRPIYHDARMALVNNEGSLANIVTFDGQPTEVKTLAARSDGLIIAGGNFRNLVKFEGFPVIYRHSLAMLTPSLEMIGNFEVIVANPGHVQQIVPLANGEVLVVGAFSLVNGMPQIAAARLSREGDFDAAFVPPFRRSSNQVSSAIALPDGSYLLGGNFTDNYTDQDLVGQTLVLVDQRGALLPFPRYGLPFPTLLLDTNGRILVGGWGGLFRLLADGTLDDSFATDSAPGSGTEPDGMPGRINALLELPNGQLIVAGKFSSFASEARSTIVRLNANGTLDTTFVSPTFETLNPSFSPPEAYAVALQGAQVLVGSNAFVQSGEESLRSLVRLGADGALDPTFANPFGNNGGEVRALHTLSDGSIMVGGTLQIVAATQIYNHIFQLQPNGQRNPAFGVGVTSFFGFGTGIYDIALTTDNRLLIGGLFPELEDLPRLSFGGYILQESAEATIEPEREATLTIPDDGIDYLFPSGTFTETVTFTHTPQPTTNLPATGGLRGSGYAFTLTAVATSSGAPTQPAPGQAFTLTLEPLEVGSLIPATCGLWRWDEASSTWTQDGITSSVSEDGTRLTATISHLSLFAVLGESHQVYLPFAQR
nr:delta-60 repeat domain-containing protein [Candidatus Chloroploca mongolica]